MKTTCFIQIVPKLSRNGAVMGLVAKALSQGMPRVVRDGAFLVRLDLNLPDDAFKPTVVQVDIPLEKMAKQVTATIS